MYQIIFSKSASKVFLRLPNNIAILIREKLDRLAEDPYQQNPVVKKLQNRPGYRLRVGDWRVIYDIQSDQLIIIVLKIASRGDVYR